MRKSSLYLVLWSWMCRWRSATTDKESKHKGQSTKHKVCFYDSTAFMVSGAFGGAVHDWSGWRADQTQRDLDVHVHRVDAERRQPDIRRVLEFLPRRLGSVVRLYRDDRSGGGSVSRLRNHHLHLSQSRIAGCR